jgi:dephospho-CoA kinase
LLEKKINKKDDILVFVQSKQIDIYKKLKKRQNFNQRLLKKFKDIQYPTKYKKKKSNFVIKNDFTKKTINNGIKNILKEII